jgi:HEAT repeat protein
MKKLLTFLLALGLAVPATAAEPAARGKPLSAWVEALKTPKTREQALLAIADIGPEARDAVGDVTPFLKDDSPLVRVRAAQALWRINRDKEVVGVLAEALADRDGKVRAAAAKAVGDVGPSAADAVPALIDLLAEPGGALAGTAAESLRVIGDAAVPHVVKALGHKDLVVRRKLCEFLGWRLVPTPDVLPALRERLDDEDGRTRVKAAQAVWLLSRDADKLGPVFAAVLEGKDADARREALIGLVWVIKQPPPEVAPALPPLFKDSDPGNRIRAAEALWRVTRKTDDALPVLTEALKQPGQTRVEAAETLARIGPDARGAAPALVPLLTVKDDPNHGSSAAYALGHVGAAAELGGVIEDRKVPAPVRENAAKWLHQAGDAGVKEIVRLLDTEDDSARRLAADAAVPAGRAARDAVPGLIKALRDKDADSGLRRSAAVALGAVGPDAAAAVGALVEALGADDGETRLAALTALAQVGFEAKDLTPSVKKLLKDGDPKVRAAAARVLWLADRTDPDVLPPLVEMVKEGGPGRVAASEVLGRMGEDARAAVPALAEALKDVTDLETWRRVSWALQDLGPVARPAVPTYLGLLKDPGKGGDFVAGGCLTAFGRVGADPRDVVPLAVKMLEDNPDQPHRSTIIQLLVTFGPDAKEAVPVLLKLLDHPEKWTRLSAGQALARIDPEKGRAALPLFRDEAQSRIQGTYPDAALVRLDPEDPQPVVRLAAAVDRVSDAALRPQAIGVVGQLGPAAKKAAPALARALKDDDVAIRLSAAESLWRVTGETKDALAVLSAALTGAEKEEMRTKAAAVLGEMGPAAKDAVGALREAAGHGDMTVRRAAGNALRKVEPTKEK